MAAVFPASRIEPRATFARWDLLFVVCAAAHGVLLITWPSIPVVAIMLWWSANTIAHNFIHRPFFRSSAANKLFSSGLTLLFGFPQSLWRLRHLAHHGGSGRSIRLSGFLVYETILTALFWLVMLISSPRFLVTVYLPGWVAGLLLCQMQGYFEHRGDTTSHYGWLYNKLFFNDGYHREHHARPGAHWRELPSFSEVHSTGSRWPAVLRCIDAINLCSLERGVLHSRVLQRFVVNRHERAMRRLLQQLPQPSNVGIVGGGLFPRTALVLRRVLPNSQLALIDLSEENLEIARDFVGADVQCVNSRFDPAVPSEYEMLIVPLAFIGDREAIYTDPPAKAVLVHDWIWHPRGESTIVSWLLLKRLNLVMR